MADPVPSAKTVPSNRIGGVTAEIGRIEIAGSDAAIPAPRDALNLDECQWLAKTPERGHRCPQPDGRPSLRIGLRAAGNAYLL
jgi:hypothetical protein